MQGKLVWALAFVGILVIIGPANGCKLCGLHTCPSCGHSPDHGYERGGVSLSMPVIQPSPLGLGYGGYGGLGGLGLGGLGPLGLGGLGPLGLGGMGGMGGLGGLGGLGGSLGAGGNLCSLCGGYNNGYPRGDAGYGRGYGCRCPPRRRYHDY